jgi:hypothetical protein
MSKDVIQEFLIVVVAIVAAECVVSLLSQMFNFPRKQL